MYFRLQLSGTIAGIEQFSLNPVFDVEGETSEGWIQTVANNMVTAAAAVDIPANLLFLASSRSVFQELRLEGRSSADDSLIGVAVAAYTGEQPGSAAVAVMPPQSAVVISMRTDTPSASGRGRIYWPALGAQIGSTLRLSSPTTEQLAQDAATYLNGVQTALQNASEGFPSWTTMPLAVRSKTTKTTPHVRRLMVGDVIDTQRRRRDALPENYATLAYPAV